jgi:hypothetical protein
VPDLQQRAVALRTAPPGDRSWLPSHVCRSHARSEDAAVIGAFGRSRPDHVTSSRPRWKRSQRRSQGTWRSPGRGTRARIMAVVKADGYGHGACTVAQPAVAAGAEWVGRTDIAEASELRATGLTVQIPHSTCRMDLSPRPSLLLVALVSPWSQGRSRNTNPWVARPMGGYDARAQESSGGAYAWVLDHSRRSLQDR